MYPEDCGVCLGEIENNLAKPAKFVRKVEYLDKS
jgi:hypothetical protein